MRCRFDEMTEDSFINPGKSEESYEDDLDLCRDIASGSLSSWHRFLSQYSGLLFNVIRRHLFVKDDDDQRTVFVDVIERLYKGDLSRYRGESALSTWLVVYTRCRVIDYTRKRHGRLRMPRNHDKMTDLDRCVLQHYFADRLPLRIVIHALRWSGFDVKAEDIIESIERIRRTIGQRYLDQLENEWLARRHDLDSSKMLKFMIQIRGEQQTGANKRMPDYDLIRREAEETAEQVRSLLSYLSPLERKIIHLRFNRSLAASKIAKRLGMKSQNSVYYQIGRIIKKLRNSLGIDEM